MKQAFSENRMIRRGKRGREKEKKKKKSKKEDSTKISP